MPAPKKLALFNWTNVSGNWVRFDLSFPTYWANILAFLQKPAFTYNCRFQHKGRWKYLKVIISFIENTYFRNRKNTPNFIFQNLFSHVTTKFLVHERSIQKTYAATRNFTTLWCSTKIENDWLFYEPPNKNPILT